jgi:prepilin-type N-terminal cleavage/methylation domain-containing protein
MFTLHHRVNSRGFTLTEVAIVLGVMGTILGAIWTAASLVNVKKNSNKIIQDIMFISSGVRELYPSGNTGVGMQNLTQIAVNSGAVPSSLVTTACTGVPWPGWFAVNGVAGCILSSWNREILIATQTAWGTAPAITNGFELLLGTFTAAQCGTFLPKLVQAAAGDGGLVWVYTDGPPAIATPVTSATPITTFQNCGGNVVLQFRL